MRINQIQNYVYTTAFGENKKNTAEAKKEHKFTAKEIGYGLAGLAAIGIATYAIIKKGRKDKAEKALEDGISGIKGKGKPPKTKRPQAPDAEPEPKSFDVASPQPQKTPDQKPKDPEPSPPQGNPQEPHSGNSEPQKPDPATRQPEADAEPKPSSAAPDKTGDEQIPSEKPKNNINLTDDAQPQNGNPPTSPEKPKEPAAEAPAKTDTADEPKTEEQPQKQDKPPVESIERRVLVTPELIQPYKEGKIEEKPFSILGIGEKEPFEGVEKLKYVMLDNEHGRTYQQFFHKNKIYETNVYDDVFGEFFDTGRVTRYNYAYENGKIIGVAKQLLSEGNNQHGIYENGGFIPFPIMVKMKGDKEYHKVDACTADALFELDKRFDPRNI